MQVHVQVHVHACAPCASVQGTLLVQIVQDVGVQLVHLRVQVSFVWGALWLLQLLVRSFRICMWWQAFWSLPVCHVPGGFV